MAYQSKPAAARSGGPSQTENPSTLQTFKDTIESLVVAFILAFVFITFVVEAFVIPTGSMADTLRGTHFRLVCPSCGYHFNYGFNSQLYGLAEGTVPRQPVQIHSNQINYTGAPVCPMCGTRLDTTRARRVAGGDRILVLKFLYQFADPEPWDVVVFKNPELPQQNFIKRLVGLPGQTIEIIDGDVYADGQILRKPWRVQNELWIDAYLSDYQPVDSGRRNERVWDDPLTPEPGSHWQIGEERRTFRFAGSAELDVMRFNPDRVRQFALSFCPYNGHDLDHRSIASDLDVEFVLTPETEGSGVAVMLGKYGRVYRADVRADGRVSITDESRGGEVLADEYVPQAEPAGAVLAQGEVGALPLGRATRVRFALVDHALYLTVGDETLEFLGPDDPAAWGYEATDRLLPTIAVGAQGGPLMLQKVRLARDVHYTNHAGGDRIGRATEGHPFALGEDEFFVLGDNSPQSHDGRFWQVAGLSNDEPYTAGVVPRDYLIGRALFVYWPSGFHLPRFPLALIPNAGEMRFIN